MRSRVPVCGALCAVCVVIFSIGAKAGQVKLPVQKQSPEAAASKAQESAVKQILPSAFYIRPASLSITSLMSRSWPKTNTSRSAG